MKHGVKFMYAISICLLLFTYAQFWSDLKTVKRWQSKAIASYEHQLQEYKEWRSNHEPIFQEWWTDNSTIIALGTWASAIDNIVSLIFSITAFIMARYRRKYP